MPTQYPQEYSYPYQQLTGNVPEYFYNIHRYVLASLSLYQQLTDDVTEYCDVHQYVFGITFTYFAISI